MRAHLAWMIGAAAMASGSVVGGERSSFEQDREAILAMAGKFRVEFNFEETVSLVKGYALKEPYHEEALEMVKVVEDHGREIVLQHILLADDGQDVRVVKHWGQVWKYEDTEILEYQGERTWKKRTLSPGAVKGTWTQYVTQVDDSPRYESWGKWTHEGNRSAWESQETPRPLPRREHTKRSDYGILMAVNRHVITPEGWVHEQDNRKWAVDRNEIICHEAGLNYYTRCEEDFSVAEKQWEATERFWQGVRREWAAILEERESVSYHKDVGGKSLVRATGALAKKVLAGERLDEQAVSRLLSSFTNS